MISVAETCVLQVLPSDIHRVVMLDADLKFKADIKELYDRFDLFTADNIMGIGREMQPVYHRHFSTYRQLHPGYFTLQWSF